jgi:alkylation response protein AidB-like acyl-CoA dehydrogenase
MLDLALTETQQMLRESARAFLEKEAPKSVLREIENDPLGYSRPLWRKMTNLGWLGLSFPETAGGSGGTLIDAGILAEELGRAALPSPYIQTVVVILALLESEGPRSSLIERILSGDLVVGLTLNGEFSRSKSALEDVRLTSTGDGGHRLSGRKRFVEFGQAARLLFTTARTPGDGRLPNNVSILIVDSETEGIEIRKLRTMGGDPVAEVKFRDVYVSKEQFLAPVGEGDRIVTSSLDRMTVLRCSSMVGGARRVMEMTVEYAKLRAQFGRPIGSFQAVQHMCADMAILVDGAELATREAVWKVASGRFGEKEVSVAKVFAAEAFRRVTVDAAQIHGGIGYMKEYDLNIYYRRAKTEELLLGDTRTHLERIAELV